MRRACSSASLRCGWRREAPTSTLSRTLISSNVMGTWKVRPMPARACVSGEARVKSLPSNMMRPPVGIVSPARQLKKVDLPAPLGPMRPMISPSSTVRSAPATAQKLPNALETFVASSSMGALPKAWREALPQLVQAAGLKARDQDDDAAVDDEGQAGAAAAELGVHG